MGFGSFVQCTRECTNAQRPSERSGGDPTLHGTEKDMELHVGCRGSRGVKLWLHAAEKKMVGATEFEALPRGRLWVTTRPTTSPCSADVAWTAFPAAGHYEPPRVVKLQAASAVESLLRRTAVGVTTGPPREGRRMMHGGHCDDAAKHLRLHGPRGLELLWLPKA